MNLPNAQPLAGARRTFDALFGGTDSVLAVANVDEQLPPPHAGGEEARVRAAGSRADERPKAVPEGRAGWDGGAL